jgi:hypothetical protein
VNWTDWFSVNIVIYFEQANYCRAEVILVLTETAAHGCPELWPPKNPNVMLMGRIYGFIYKFCRTVTLLKEICKNAYIMYKNTEFQFA